MSEKVIITVAPLAQRYYDEVDGFPTAKELAKEIIQSCHAGASVCHLHVIDDKGEPTFDTSFFEEVLKHVRSGCDIIMQGSTGGISDLSLDERSVSVEVEGVEMASLNMGSCDVGETAYINRPGDVRYWAEKMKKNNVKPEMVFFEPGMIREHSMLQEKGLIDKPYVANIALGFPNTLAATPKNLLFMSELLPDNIHWLLTTHHNKDFSLQAMAVTLAGHVRVGFEDSFYLSPDKRAKNNPELVRQAAEMINLLGREVAKPSQTRQMYGLA